MRSIVLVTTVLTVLAGTASVGEADVTTEIPGVTARVAYVRAWDSVLHVGVTLRNASDRRVDSAPALRYADAFIVDRIARRTYAPLRDANGIAIAGPIGDLGDGGRWFPALEPHSEALVWIMFPALADGRHFDLHLPLVPSFDDLGIDASAPAKSVQGSLAPVTASVVSQSRSNGWVDVQLAIENPTSHRAGPTAALRYSEMYLLDRIHRKRYALVSDRHRMWFASPMSDKNDGGRWFVRLAGGQRVPMKVVFEAPPDGVDHVDLVVPGFPPIEAIALTGSSGAPDRGVPVTSEARVTR